MTEQTERSRGRTVPPLPRFTCPESGYVLRVRRVSTGIIARIQQHAAKELDPERPQPPVQRVATGPGETREIGNTSDPEYLEALARHQEQVRTRAGMKVMQFVQEHVIVLDDDEIDHEAVASYRAALAHQGLDVTEDDRSIYLWSIACATPTDIRALLAFVTGQSEPDREAVQMHKAMFRRDVPGTQPG